jgi:hypothetical protein
MKTAFAFSQLPPDRLSACAMLAVSTLIAAELSPPANTPKLDHQNLITNCARIEWHLAKEEIAVVTTFLRHT